METQVGAEGLSFDYGFYKKEIEGLCEELDEYFLLPEHNPHLQLQPKGEQVQCTFAGKEFVLLAEDVKILPVSNITVEEMSRWMAGRLQQTCGASFASHGITACSLEVASGPGQSASFSF